MKTKHTEQNNIFAFIIAHTSAFMIAICCAITSYYFLSISALPLLAIPAATSGFILNYLLFFKDHKDFEETLSHFWTQLKKRPLAFSVACCASLLQAIFTYDIWIKMLQTPGFQALLIPSYFPLLFSGAYFFGTFVLLGHDLVSTETKADGTEVPTYQNILNDAFNFKDMSLLKKSGIVITYLLTATALFSLFWYTYLPSTIAVIPHIWRPVIRHIVIGALFVSISFCEVIFNLRSVGSALGLTFNGQLKAAPKPNFSAFTVGFIITLNAIGNGLIGIGESVMTGPMRFFLAGCNFLMSVLVMYNSNLEKKALTFSHHFDSIRKIPKSNVIVPLTWIAIASLWIVPHIPMTSLAITACYTGICTLITLSATYFLDSTPRFKPLTGYNFKPDAAPPSGGHFRGQPLQPKTKPTLG